jgi:type IV pilus assembly protein PilC
MHHFRFKAVDASGKSQAGEATARDQNTLVADLRARGLTVLDIKEDTPDSAEKKLGKEVSFGFDFGVSRKALALFTRQLATTLSAGLPLLKILHVLHRKNDNRSLRKLLEQAGQDLQKGSSFSDALARHPKVFDAMYLNMVKVGEAGGTLPQAVSRLAVMMEKEMALRRKVKAALSYPVFVLIFSATMAYVLLAYLMPMFTPMFETAHLDIEHDFPITWYLMNASKVATNPVYVGLLIGCLVALYAIVKIMEQFPKGQYILDWMKYNAPAFHGLIQQSATARFCRCFAGLLQSGVPMLQALSLVSDAAGNAVVSASIQRVARNIQSGDRISVTLEQVGIFPDLVVQMAEIGEEAGTLPEMLQRVAEYFEEELDTTVSSITALIEPAMMMVVGGMVGVFVMGVLLPILGISTAMQNQMQGGK